MTTQTEETKDKELTPYEKKELEKHNVSFERGIIPRDLADVIRLANVIHQAQLAPKSFDTPQKVAVGIMTNMELGRPVISGLQDLSIVNGVCKIYGDAVVAQVLASGQMEPGYPKETETGTPFQDDWAFTYAVKRKNGVEALGKFSWADAKLAGFDDLKTKTGAKDIWSPWTRFTRRMMQWKARNFVLRDNFGDIIKGMHTVEDAHDYINLNREANGTYALKKTEEMQDMEMPSAEFVKPEGEKPAADPELVKAFDEAVETCDIPAEIVTQYLDRGKELGKIKDIDQYKHDVMKANGIEPFLAACRKHMTEEIEKAKQEPEKILCPWPDCKQPCTSERGLKKHITQSHAGKWPPDEPEEPPPATTTEEEKTTTADAETQVEIKKPEWYDPFCKRYQDVKEMVEEVHKEEADGKIADILQNHGLSGETSVRQVAGELAIKEGGQKISETIILRMRSLL